ncbi:MAG: CotH kinase family protein [candidate division Zixibacteria bacterium]|nr:CotH kinase family protein [candidate division Zixibacteria bacterium]
MKKVFLSLLFTLLSLGTVSGQDFYDIRTINTIEIIFEELDWDYILDSLYAMGEEDRLLGTAYINGVRYDSVGVRYKGASTYNPLWKKNPFNIELDNVIEGQSIDGYKTLKLANVLRDPSFVREVLGYEIARDYMPASRANYIKVSVNDEYLGLYTNVQSVDKFFARRYDYDADGARFKGDLVGLQELLLTTIWGYRGEEPDAYYQYYELKSDSGWNALIDFLEVLNHDAAGVEAVLDVDRHLWMLAFDNLLVNLDAPVNINHNFYLYQDFSRRFSPIIWDLNECFGGFKILMSTGKILGISQLQKLDPLVHLNHPDFPIIGKILSYDRYRKKYFAHMRTIIEEKFANHWYENRALQIQAIIEDEVDDDPNKFYSTRDFRDNIYRTIYDGLSSIIGLVQLMDARVAYLESRPEFQADQPVISDPVAAPETIAPGTTAVITARVTNADSVWLYYRQASGRAFEEIPMHDDGGHGDGAAGDNTFGTAFVAGNGDIHYFIYAENGEAGFFAPARAAYDYYVVEVTAPVVPAVKINEFMAANSKTIIDQDGDFDDWLELYNASDSAVGLAGFYLSDNISNLTQWSFPDTHIAPHGYLLVWADGEEEQAGLHAGFKLSASGEALVLATPELAVVDQISFGAQTSDVSFGRSTDGGDDWRFFTTPTPGNSNNDISCCRGSVGNCDCSEDEEPDVSDILRLIDYLYLSREPLCCPGEAAIVGDGETDISDITRLVDYLFLSRRPLPLCP